MDKQKVLAQTASKLWVNKDLSQLNQIYDEHCIHHQQRHHVDNTFIGIEKWRNYIEEFLKKYPNYEEQIIFQVSETDKVVSMLKCHAGNIFWSGVVIDQIESNKIKETWAWFKRDQN